MLTITDASGNNLMLYPPPPISVVEDTSSAQSAAITIYAEINESDQNLPFQFINAYVDWDDGTPAVVLPEASGALIVNVTRDLVPGTYAITVHGENSRAPVPDTVMATFMVTVTPLRAIPVPANFVYGPILPKDTGSPSAATWLFDTGSDVAILASSVKMLLITNKGERVMQPQYGTGLRRILFELNINAAQAMVQQEITTALATWEPRVSIAQLAVTPMPNSRSIAVTGVFVSNLLNAPFQMQTLFNP